MSFTRLKITASLATCVDFLCHPEFDSPTIFASLLDDQRGGFFQIQPELGHSRVRQLYLPNTNILLKRLLSDEEDARRYEPA